VEVSVCVLIYRLPYVRDVPVLRLCSTKRVASVE
jgi:hypothetical protein